METSKTARFDDWLLHDEDEDDDLGDCNALYRTASLEGEGVTKIRLLHIARSEHIDDPLELSFTVASLTDDELPEYVALSYTWRASGDGDELLHDVGFAGRYRKRITYNLLLAMRALRYLGYLTVWIDQLSINQEDLKERGEQVRSMSQIFSKASKVIIYLGEETKTARVALECLPDISSFVHQCRKAETDGQDLRSVPWLRLRRDILEAWLGIYDYSWFKRVWVVQETLLAKNSSFVVGLQEYDALPLRLSHYFLSSGVDSMVKSEFNRTKDAFKTRSKILNAWAWLTRAHDHHHVLEAFYNKSLEAMDWMREFGATDKRDRIFAMLEPLRLDAVPDYTANIPTVYTRFAASQVRRGSAFEIIEAAGRHNQEYEGLPSWVPDWTAPRRYHVSWSRATAIRYPQVDGFVTSLRKTIVKQIDHVLHSPAAGILFLDTVQLSTQRPRIASRLNLFELAMKGAVVGRIASIAPALPKQRDDVVHVRNVLQWHREVRRLAFHTQTRRYPDAVERVGAMVRLTALAFDLVNQNTTTTAYLQNLELLEKLAAGPLAGPDWDAAKRSRILELVPQEHRICFTHEGHIALVPEASQRGDCIAVLVGYENAVTLTPLGHDRFTYIGAAHVLDILEERCRLEMQKIILR